MAFEPVLTKHVREPNSFTLDFYLQHGGKSNLVRLGSRPVLSPTELKPYDLIRIGRTTLLFVACCGPDFSWTDEVQEG